MIMITMINTRHTSIQPLSLKAPAFVLPSAINTNYPGSQSFSRSLIYKPLILRSSARGPLQWCIRACTADQDIDMVRNKEGVYAAKPKKVVVLWDLDNKPPRGPPYQAAMALRRVAQFFGEVVDISAYANRHAFIHLPNWVVEERRERRHLDFLERKGAVAPLDPYVCSVCGRKLKTNLDLKKHFRQLHERERQKKLSRMRSLKGKKRQRFKERFIVGNEKYNEAARTLLTPKIGYGLAPELRRAGVFVKTVEDKPQAADWALKRQMQHSMSRGIDWLFLVSDDSDFSEMLRKARGANLGTVVVGDFDRALGRHADLWVPWNGVENGEISEEDLLLKLQRNRESWARSSSRFSYSEFSGTMNGDENLDGMVDQLIEEMEFVGGRISAFSEGDESNEDDDEDDDREDWLQLRLSGEHNSQHRDFSDWDEGENEAASFLLDTEDETEDDDDLYR